MLDFETLSARVRLNKNRFERVAYKTKLCYKGYCYDEAVIRAVVRQIAINLSWVIYRFDRIDGEELILELRKNCIKGFERDVCSSENQRSHILQLQTGKRKEAKGKIMYICNQMWAYVNQAA